MSTELASLRIGDDPALWSRLGFVVEGGAASVSGVRHVLGASEPGICGWSLRGAGVTDIDGLALDAADAADAADATDANGATAVPEPAHPNGVIALDHVVLASPDLHRTVAAVEAAGIELRRVRDVGRDRNGALRQQAFFKLGTVILELVGPAEPQGDAPPRFYGLAWTVRDLDETASFLGDALRRPKDAVQPGRRIATLDRSAGSTVAMAFMTSEERPSAS